MSIKTHGQDFTFRIIKIGGRAVSVALCAMTGMIFMGGAAMATTVIATGNSTPAVQDIAANPYINIQSASIDALGVTTYYNPWSGTSTWNDYNTVLNNAITLQSGNKITGRTLEDGATYAAIYSQNTKLFYGSATNVNYTSLSSATFNLQGNNIVNGAVGLNFTNWIGSLPYYYGTYVDPLAVINLNGYNVTFGDTVYAANTYVNAGTNNTVNNDFSFYGTLNSNLTFNQAASVLLNGGLNGGLNFNGYNSYVTLGANQTITGNVTTSGVNGMLVFQGAGNVNGTVGSSTSTLREVRTNGTGNVLFGQQAYVDYVNYQAATLVGFTGGLNLTGDQSSQAQNQVAFNNNDGVLQINTGNLTGNANSVVVSTTGNNLGTVTMVSGTQSITGGIGASGHAIKTLNIGGNNTGVLDTSTSNYSTTTANGDIFAQNIKLNNNGNTNDSSLIMASGYNLTGTVTTDTNSAGVLTLVGGTQTVTGTVGATLMRLKSVSSGVTGATSTFTDAVHADTVSNTGAGTTTFNTSVDASTINVASGISNFTTTVNNNGGTATVNIGTGVGNFNTDGTSATKANLVFTASRSVPIAQYNAAVLGNATANLNTGLTGNIDFANKDATVNVAAGKMVTGTATSSGGTNGTVNFLGGGSIGGDVGTWTSGTPTSDTGLAKFNVGTAGAGTVTANGNLLATSVSINNDSTLNIASGKNVTAAVSTGSNGTGTLTMVGGTQVVNGLVGAADKALKLVNAGTANSTTTFNNLVVANTLQYAASNSTVVLNGTSGAAGGLKGTVNFGTTVDPVMQNSSTLQIGSGVNLTTGTGGIQFANANNATLTFAGNSTVTGVLGSNDSTVFKTINAGVTGMTVTFLNDVYVSDHTLHVTGTGVVNLQGNLNGSLIYDANGSVNVGDGKGITGAVNTTLNNQGTLNFVGGTTTQNPIGTSLLQLARVGFHNATTDGTTMPLVAGPVAVNIGSDVFAVNTFIGNGSSSTNATTANITATGKYLGTNLTLSNNTTLNTAGAVYSSAVSPVDFVNSKFADGTVAPAVTVTQSTVGTGTITTNNATLNFAVGTQAWSEGAGGLVNADTSSKITGDTGSRLVMSASGTTNVSLLGSLKNGQTATLIDVAGGTEATVPGTYQDNSFVIDTQLSRNAGDLVMTASRDANTYVTKSGTSGDISNNAAVRLATLAADGASYGQDMQTVLNKLDIDQWGYGNNQANLATQVKRLAPIANNAMGLSALALGAMADDSLGLRMHELRNVPQQDAYETGTIWLKNSYLRGSQADGVAYDGYTSKLSGLSLGLDSRPDNSSIVGAALSYGAGTVNQTQFRTGDQSNLTSTQLSFYGAYDFTPELFVDGSISFAKQNTTGNRATAVGRTALFNFDGTQSAAKLEMGYRIKFDDSTTALTPLLSFEDRTLNQNAYVETNAGDIGLNVASQRLQNKQTGLGLRLTSTQYMGGMVVKPDLLLMATRDNGLNADPVTASFIGDASSAASFTTGVASYPSNSAKFAFGVGLLMSKTSSITLRGQYEKRETYTSNMAEMVARWDF